MEVSHTREYVYVCACAYRSQKYRILMTVVLAMIKMLGIVFGMLLVDYAGRRPLLVYGSMGMSISLAFLTVGASANSVALILASIYAFMFSFSISCCMRRFGPA